MMMNSGCTCTSATTFTALLAATATTTSCCLRPRQTKTTTADTKSIFFISKYSRSFSSAASSSQDPQHHVHHPFLLRVTNDQSRTELSSNSDSVSEKEYLRSEADRIVDGLNFGELCNEFECISSPLVESTARQLVRDILELREGNRALGTFALSVQYKDPVRSFSGRDKYKRPLWINTALEKPRVSVQEMSMLSISVLSIKWTIKGKPKNILLAIGGDLIVKINSQFTLNQISGQVIQHEEFWDLSASSFISQAYFWTSRRLFATIEGGKDLSDAVKGLSSRFPTEKQNMDIFPDPYGDPTKFFQRDDGFQRDVYQIALFLALVYFVVQLLRTTLNKLIDFPPIINLIKKHSFSIMDFLMVHRRLTNEGCCVMYYFNQLAG